MHVQKGSGGLVGERDIRTQLIPYGGAIALVGLAALALGPSAAIALATGLVVIATVISLQSAGRVDAQRTESGPIDEEIELLSAMAEPERITASHIALDPAPQPKITLHQVPLDSDPIPLHVEPVPIDVASAAPLIVEVAPSGAASRVEVADELVAFLESPVMTEDLVAPLSQDGRRTWAPSGARNTRAAAWWGSLVRADYLSMLLWGAIAGALAWMLLTGLETNPVGFFADEAEIGYRTHELVTKRLTGFDLPIFYQHFGYTHLGALPLYASAPFVAALGLTEFSVRLASVIFAIGGLILLIALVRRLRWACGEVGILVFAFSPVFIHLSRVNFAHSPSFFCTAAGLYCFVRAKQQGSIKWAGLAGIAFGLSIYGNAAYYLAMPVVVFGLLVGEMVVNRLEWRRYLSFVAMVGTIGVLGIPVLIKVFTDDEFMRRFNDKQYSDAPLLSGDRLNTIADNYGKYFSADFLFIKGESGMPGGFISRHSVAGAGELPWIALPLVIAGIIAIFRCNESHGRAMGIAGLVTLLLYPLPDVLSTSTLNPPYTLAVFPTLIFVPLLSAFGIHWIVSELRERNAPAAFSRAVPIALLLVIVVGGMQFYRGPYTDYPNVSAEYYGWQYGPEQAITRFKDYDPIYDRYFLDGDFNEAYIFLDFYLIDDPDMRARTAIGGFELANLARHDLYAVRKERFTRLLESDDRIRAYAKVVDVIYYPNGEIAMYLVDLDAENFDGTPEEPR